jgi:hypothetical protein
MIRNQHLFACTVALILIGGVAHAGPCNSGDKAAAARDAGSGPTVGNTGQTTGTGSSNAGDHPPTSTMNRASGDTAASSQDAQRQMQGVPTAAQQAQGATPSNKTADHGC